jgi:ABC-2 type transport system permease protein
MQRRIKNMNIIGFELKSQRKNTIIWTLSLIALAALYLSMFPLIAQDGEEYKNLLANYSPTIRGMLGIQIDYLTSLFGYYSMIFSFVLLGGAIQAMNLGLSLLTKESRERTADFLFVKPVSRTTIITAKLIAAFLLLILTNTVFFGGSFLLATLVKQEDFEFGTFLIINLTLLSVQIIFFSLGLVISVFFRKLKSVLPLSLGVVFGLYLAGSLLTTGEHGDIVRYFTPFKYFDIVYIIQNGSYELSYSLTGLAVTVISIVISYILFVRKDIHAVS